MKKPKPHKPDRPVEQEKTVPLFDHEDNKLIPTGLRVPVPKPKN